MKFSVLMSLYDKENPIFLGECLESLHKQSLPANEIVLVYDGEITPELDKVVSLWQNRLPFKIIKLIKNVGLGKALQKGLEQCQYDWVMRMDTDDICHPNRFEKQVTFLSSHPDIDICGGQIIEFDASIDEQNISVRTVPRQHEEIYQYAQSRNPMNHMTVSYKKSTVLDSGGYQYAPLYEDYDLWVRMLLKGYRFANIDLLVYARTGNAMYQRRGGLSYVKNEINMQRRFYQLGFLTIVKLLKNLAIRIPVRLFPNKLRQWIYKSLLRK